MQFVVRSGRYSSFFRCLFCVVGLILASRLTIDIYPVPVTMQTFAVYLIALFCSPAEAFVSILGYLSVGFLGGPVFAPAGVYTAGYLFGMLIGGSAASYLLRHKFSPTCSLLACYFIVHLFGCLCLASYIGALDSLRYGVVPFIIPEMLKMVTAISVRLKLSEKMC